MSEYGCGFSLISPSKAFVDLFAGEIEAVFEENPTYSNGFGGEEKKELEISSIGETYKVAFDVDDLFDGVSEEQIEGMTGILKACIKKIPDVVFTADYDISCYLCGDNAETHYQYDGKYLIEKSKYENDVPYLSCPHCGKEIGCCELVALEDWEPEKTYNCPNCEGTVLLPYSYDEFLYEDCTDKTFVITGKLKLFENRDEFVEYIEDLGGKVVGGISSKTDFLICNDASSTSSKTKKAKELGIPIITEEEFIRRFGDPGEFELGWEDEDEEDEDE